MKKLVLPVITAIVLLVLTGCSVKAPEEYYKTESIETDKTVLMSVDCSDIFDNMEKLDPELKDYIPEYGLVLPDKEYPIKDDDTVYDLLIRAARENRVQTESKGLFGKKEIEGINYIYTSSCGKGSRWTYTVNGNPCQPVCSDVKLNDGDVVKWTYLCG